MGSLQPYFNSSKIFKYADDVIIATSYENQKDMQELIQDESKNMAEWCDNNGLALNLSKTKTMNISKKRNKESLSTHNSFVQELTILGLKFCDNLKWTQHIDHISKKASQRVYVLKQLKNWQS